MPPEISIHLFSFCILLVYKNISIATKKQNHRSDKHQTDMAQISGFKEIRQKEDEFFEKNQGSGWEWDATANNMALGEGGRALSDKWVIAADQIECSLFLFGL